MAKFKLKAKVAKLDEVPEAFRGAYVEKDGSHVLDAEKLEAIEWDDKEELAGALENERKERKRLKGEVDKFAGLDPERARLAQKKLDDLEAKELMDKGEFDRLLKKRSDEYGEKETAFQQQLEKLTGELTRFKLTDKVRAAALAAGVIPEDIEDVLTLTSPRFKLGDKDQIVVLDKDGDESTLTLEKYFGEEFKTQRPKFYTASGAGGSGAPAGGSGGGGGGAVKTVSRRDQAAMNANVEEIAAGTVKVVD